MIKRLAQTFPIRRGEWPVSFVMFSYIFGVLTFYYILKPLRSALFLSELPASDLPKAYLLTAFFAGPLVTLVFKLSRRLSTIALLTATNAIIIASLFFFRWAIGRDIAHLPYAYFVYVQIVSVISVGQFWLLAGYIYDNRQAKRIYGLLGAGAIAGATAGSFLSDFLKRLSSESMLLICIVICAGLIVLSHLAWRHRRREAEKTTEARKFEPAEDRFYDLYKFVFGSRHLRLIVLLVFLTMIASQIADWQVDYATQQAFQHLPKEQMAQEIKGFRGRFNLITNILGITLQLTLTGFVVSRLGIGAAILFLPAGLFVTSIGVFMAPSLRSTTIALGCNSVFRYSINRAGLELLYLPLAPEVRKKIKLFIDVFIDRFGRATAAFVILAFHTEYFGFGLRGTALAMAAMTALCLVVAVRLRRSYVESFRQQLAVREMDLDSVGRFVTDPASVRLLVETLESTQERQLLYALRLLQSVRGIDFSRQLLPLLKHPSAAIREEATRTLISIPQDYRQIAEQMLADSSDNVRQAAVEYLCSRDVTATGEQLEQLLRHQTLEVRLAAARCAAERADSKYRPSIELVRSLLHVEGPRAAQARAAAARLAVKLPAPESIALLRNLLKDPDPEVAASAARSVGSAGHMELLFDVVSMLTQRHVRHAARETLVQYGARIVGTLGDVLADPQRDIVARREIPWVLGRIPTERSAEILIDNLGAEDPMLKYRIVKALNRLHETKPEYPAPRPRIAERIYAETQAYYEALTLCKVLAPQGPENGRKLLGRALKERLDQNLEIIFRLLGLQYPQKDIYSAYHALKAGRSERRAAAIEFLDNLLHKNLKSIILPLLEESSTERLIDRASRQFGIQTRKREDALRLILKQSDVWLKVCALHQVGEERIRELVDVARTLSNDTDPLVRETADWALKRCA